jgi:hypothetical protein
MRERHDILVAHDVVARLPEEVEVSAPELNAIFQVLRLLSGLLDACEQARTAAQPTRRQRE